MKKRELKPLDNKRFLADNIEQGLAEISVTENIPIDATVIIKNRKAGVSIPFVMVLQPFAEKFAFLDLPSKTHKVFWYLISLTQYENFVSIDINTIVENMGNVSKSSVIRAISDLEKINIVKKVAYVNDKRRHEYFINPHTMWRGNWNERQKKIKKAENNKLNLELPFGK